RRPHNGDARAPARPALVLSAQLDERVHAHDARAGGQALPPDARPGLRHPFELDRKSRLGRTPRIDPACSRAEVGDPLAFGGRMQRHIEGGRLSSAERPITQIGFEPLSGAGDHVVWTDGHQLARSQSTAWSWDCLRSGFDTLVIAPMY